MSTGVHFAISFFTKVPNDAGVRSGGAGMTLPSSSSRFFTAFSDAAREVVEGRMLMGIHFRFADTTARSRAMRVARWTYKYYLRALDGDEFDFVRTLDVTEDLDLMDAEEDSQDDGQNDDDAEYETSVR